MASVPNIFLPQTVIKSSEVNQNFDALYSTILAITGVDSATWLKDFVIGKRSNMLISGAADTGSAPSLKFLQLGWNVNFVNYGSGVWKLERFNDGEAATMIRIAEGGFEVWTTSRTAGNLNTQMNKGFGVHANSGGTDSDYIYIPNGWNIVQNETTDPSLVDLRTTLTWLDDPISLSAKVATSRGSTSVNVFDAGVPTWAKAVKINMHIKGGATSCHYKVYQERGNRVTSYGFSGRVVAKEMDGIFGDVPVGRAANAGKIVFDRSESVESQTIVVMGYYS